jgi:hypothetical protein
MQSPRCETIRKTTALNRPADLGIRDMTFLKLYSTHKNYNVLTLFPHVNSAVQILIYISQSYYTLTYIE